jgi:hypothetical protein
MAKGKSKSIKALRDKVGLCLAWISEGFAVVAGTLATDTPVGHTIQQILHLFPWAWVPVLTLIGAVVATAVDLFMDGVPNRVAVFTTLAIPSIAAASPGSFGATISRWCGDLLGWVNDRLVGMLGTNSAIGLTLACALVAVLLSRRVVKATPGTVGTAA